MTTADAAAPPVECIKDERDSCVILIAGDCEAERHLLADAADAVDLEKWR